MHYRAAVINKYYAVPCKKDSTIGNCACSVTVADKYIHRCKLAVQKKFSKITNPNRFDASGTDITIDSEKPASLPVLILSATIAP